MEKYCLENNIPINILLLTMLQDILHLLLIFNPISKWCLSLQTPPLCSSGAFNCLRNFVQAIVATEKTMMRFWKDYNVYDYVKMLLGLEVMWSEYMNDILKKILKGFIYNFKGFAKDEEFAKISNAVVEMSMRMTLRSF